MLLYHVRVCDVDIYTCRFLIKLQKCKQFVYKYEYVRRSIFHIKFSKKKDDQLAEIIYAVKKLTADKI